MKLNKKELFMYDTKTHIAVKTDFSKRKTKKILKAEIESCGLKSSYSNFKVIK